MMLIIGKVCTKQYCLAWILLAGLILFTGTAWYSTPKSESVPNPLTSTPSRPIAAEPLTTRITNDEGTALAAASTSFAPFLDVVPSQDGNELFISAGSAEVGGTVLANVGVGTGNDKGGYTMTYSNTVQAYLATATGFTAGMGTFAPLSITSTLGLDTGTVDFNRAYIPDGATPTISSQDGILQLTVVSTDTFPAEAYVAVVPSYGPPGPPPAGYNVIGSVYSVRASGAILVADRPMNLRLSYNDTILAGADPHTLAIFAWDAFNQRWDNLGGTLFYTQKFVSVVTSRFTTYALMATTTWQDNFDEFTGLDLAQFNNITLGGTPENRTLILASTPGSGSAVSQPITPTTTITSWDTLTFTHTATPPTTTLTVDILSLDGTEVLTDATSGTDLSGLIEPSQYPSLRLRVNMVSTEVGETPALEQWKLSWRVGENQPPDQNTIYLPVLVKNGL